METSNISIKNKIINILKIFGFILIFYLFYNQKYVSAATMVIFTSFLSVIVKTGKKPNEWVFSSVIDRFMLIPFLAFIVFNELISNKEFPILIFMGFLFVIAKETYILFTGFSYFKKSKPYIRISLVHKLSELSYIMVIVLYILKNIYHKFIPAFADIALIALIMISIMDLFGILWNMYKKKKNIRDINLATKITFFRLLMSPAFLIVFFYDRNPLFGDNNLIFQILAIIFAILFVVTDGLDGYFARKRNEVTKFGKYLDPFSDKICTTTIFLCFVATNYVPVWMVALIYYREASVTVIRTLAAAENIVIAARKSGKLKTALQGTAIISILAFATVLSALQKTNFPYEHAELYNKFLAVWIYLPFSLMGLVTLVTIVSGIDYIISSRVILEKYFK